MRSSQRRPDSSLPQRSSIQREVEAGGLRGFTSASSLQRELGWLLEYRPNRRRFCYKADTASPVYIEVYGVQCRGPDRQNGGL